MRKVSVLHGTCGTVPGAWCVSSPARPPPRRSTRGRAGRGASPVRRSMDSAAWGRCLRRSTSAPGHGGIPAWSSRNAETTCAFSSGSLEQVAYTRRPPGATTADASASIVPLPPGRHAEVVRAASPPDVDVAPQRAQPRARRIDQHAIEHRPERRARAQVVLDQRRVCAVCVRARGVTAPRAGRARRRPPAGRFPAAHRRAPATCLQAPRRRRGRDGPAAHPPATAPVARPRPEPGSRPTSPSRVRSGLPATTVKPSGATRVGTVSTPSARSRSTSVSRVRARAIHAQRQRGFDVVEGHPRAWPRRARADRSSGPPATADASPRCAAHRWPGRDRRASGLPRAAAGRDRRSRVREIVRSTPLTKPPALVLPPRRTSDTASSTTAAAGTRSRKSSWNRLRRKISSTMASSLPRLRVIACCRWKSSRARHRSVPMTIAAASARSRSSAS